MSAPGPERGPRTVAEWLTLGVSLAILLLVVGLILLQMDGNDEPAAPAAVATGEVRKVAGGYQVHVEVSNTGDHTAADVVVSAELSVGDEVSEAEQTVDFLAGDEAEDLIFVFADDPAAGALEVRVTGFSVP